MSFFDQINETDPRLAEEVARLDGVLKVRLPVESEREPQHPDRAPAIEYFRGEHPFIGEAVDYAFSHGEADRDEAAQTVASPSTPPGAIFGAGVLFEREAARPAIFVVDRLVRAAGVPRASVITVAQNSVIARYIGAISQGAEVPPATRFVGLEVPAEQLAPGDPITCVGQRGTCGPYVTMADGTRAVLTAGHVAQPLGMSVDDSSGRIGRVVWTDCLTNHAVGDDCADAAVVALRDGIRITAGPAISRTGVVTQRANVTTAARSGSRSGWLLALSPSFAIKTTCGAWKDVALTNVSLSKGGDSGAPVLLSRTDSVIGMVVGGADSYSVVQDIEVALSASGTQLSDASK